MYEDANRPMNLRPDSLPPVDFYAIRQRLTEYAAAAYYRYGPSDLVDNLYSLTGHLGRLITESEGPKQVGIARER